MGTGVIACGGEGTNGRGGRVGKGGEVGKVGTTGGADGFSGDDRGRPVGEAGMCRGMVVWIESSSGVGKGLGTLAVVAAMANGKGRWGSWGGWLGRGELGGWLYWEKSERSASADEGGCRIGRGTWRT